MRNAKGQFRVVPANNKLHRRMGMEMGINWAGKLVLQAPNTGQNVNERECF